MEISRIKTKQNKNENLRQDIAINVQTEFQMCILHCKLLLQDLPER